MSTRAAGPAKPPTYGVSGAVSQVVKRLRHDVEDASGVEFKNHWSRNCTYGVHGNSFTFFVFTFSVVMKSFVRARVRSCVCSLIGNADLDGNPATSQASVFHFFFLHLPKLLK
jgi:hypothetical protein